MCAQLQTDGMITTVDDESVALRPTTAWIDLPALRGNVAAIKAQVGDRRIMAIVKANAYGHGLLRTSKELLLAGADQLGVAFLEEGMALRRAGVQAPILVLGGIIGNQIIHFLEHHLQLTASSAYKLTQIDEVAGHSGRRAKVHLKIDTGLERIGVHWDTAPALLEAATRALHCDIEGVFTHLASSDAEEGSYTRLQLERFDEALDFFPRRSLPMPPRHVANSAAICQHPASYYEMVRPGLLLYGAYPAPHLARSVPVSPVLSLKTRVVYFKVVRRGCPVSYGSTWTAPENRRVVTLPVGYGDGYARSLSGKAQVLIGGRRYPVIGNITMDAMMVDIGHDSAYNGDEVVLCGRQGGDCIRAEELAGWLGTVPYEILTAINTRVPRRYVE